MSTVAHAWELPPVKPLDEEVWQAWVRRGRVQDRRTRAAQVKAVKWISIAGLLAAAGLSSYLPPYEVVIRFVVAAGAIVMMFQSFQSSRFAFVSVFGVLALLYNPVVPVFSFSGIWSQALVVASLVPFVASLAWPNVKPSHDV
jgi:hypothetical protein